MHKGFSFLELMIVMVIIVVATTIAIPSYAKYNEKSRGKSAEANLTAIYNMEKRYKLDNGVYYECATAGCNATLFACPSAPDCSLTKINDPTLGLGLYIRDSYFTYDIAIDNVSGFKVTAKRAVGNNPCSGKVMTITSSNSAINKTDCSVW